MKLIHEIGLQRGAADLEHILEFFTLVILNLYISRVVDKNRELAEYVCRRQNLLNSKESNRWTGRVVLYETLYLFCCAISTILKICATFFKFLSLNISINSNQSTSLSCLSRAIPYFYRSLLIIPSHANKPLEVT